MVKTVSQMTFEDISDLQLRERNCNKMNGSRSLELHLIADFLVLNKSDFFVAIDKLSTSQWGPPLRARNFPPPKNGETDW